MNLLSHTVFHTQFGEGKVISHEGDYLTVVFGIGEKLFQYPDAFKRFLSVDNTLTMEEIQRDISDIDQKNEAIKKHNELNVQEKLKMKPKTNLPVKGTHKSIGICTESVQEAVSCIPFGKIMTYADIADYVSGSRRGAQAVSTILLNNSDWGNCHRVVMAEGKLSPGYKGGLGPEVQRKELEAEGVTFDSSGKVLINKHKWKWRMMQNSGGGSKD